MDAKVLVVDDAPTNVRLLANILEREGCEVVTAADGGEALERARQDKPDLILLDILMPVKNGFEVCEELKRDLATADIPIIFLSALGDSSDRVKGLELGAVDFVSKPVDRIEVVARVRTHLKLRELTSFLIELNEELQEKQRRRESELEAAAAIQRSLLPPERVAIPDLEVTWRFQPCDELGGDIFNVEALDDRTVALYVLDVAGHGVASSLVAVSVAQLLQPGSELFSEGASRAGELGRPGAMLHKLDETYPIERFDRYFTIFLGLLDLPTGRLRYSAAAHPPGLVLRRDGSLSELEAGGSLIGMGGFLPFEEGEATLAPGDRLFLYTDGIPEHPDETGALFGVERFHSTLRAERDAPLGEACSSVITELLIHGGGRKPPDDISLIGLELRPEGGDGS
jgi:sigma-B regulation protein RsbU (phosphoserine phosphatase)